MVESRHLRFVAAARLLLTERTRLVELIAREQRTLTDRLEQVGLMGLKINE